MHSSTDTAVFALFHILTELLWFIWAALKSPAREGHSHSPLRCWSPGHLASSRAAENPPINQQYNKWPHPSGEPLSSSQRLGWLGPSLTHDFSRHLNYNHLYSKDYNYRNEGVSLSQGCGVIKVRSPVRNCLRWQCALLGSARGRICDVCRGCRGHLKFGAEIWVWWVLVLPPWDWDWSDVFNPRDEN